VPNTKFYSTSFYARLQNCEKRLLALSCLSVRPHGTTRFPLDGFSWNNISEFFENMSRKYKCHKNRTIIKGTLHDRYTFLIISRSFILRMRNVSDNNCRKKIKTRILCWVTLFRKSYHLWDNVEKYWRAGQATDDNMAHEHCVLGN
jgi:hypothetical protein